MTPCAAKWADCCDEPHWRSTLVPTTDSGNPAARAALRPMFRPCSPVCMTQPMITSSTSAGSRSLRSTSAFRVSAARSTGCQSFSFPLRLPSAVRTASTMTAVAMRGFLLRTRPVGQVSLRSRRTATWPRRDHLSVTDEVTGDELERIERLSRLLGLQTLLAHVAREIGPALEVQAVLQAVLGAMRSLMDFQSASILLVEDRELHVAASDPRVDEDVAKLRIPIGT